ncbi:hypothetical protein BFV94_4633 [Alteromonas macleodii]|uniref:Uncharacterized protein n=1 Tax=Alteromonas macleodii TaxID=28108 RepID=A0AB36FLL0_ALTMA|nr:hypothetical protein BFV93_4896 [Alteromonas macleodii]OES24885.1 hypothetical protein BFV94_4633 [Alteromonas macleodii]OES25728.1 hypothetical protein BFV95_4304 [Alteromonas macleodii]OES38448.1 hypothetical protein BFV96_4964 [Alteromonas macleodii]
MCVRPSIFRFEGNDNQKLSKADNSPPIIAQSLVHGEIANEF